MNGVAPLANQLDAFPKILIENARVRGTYPANRKKYHGIWVTWSWPDIAKEIRALACGLKSMGVMPGDKICI